MREPHEILEGISHLCFTEARAVDFEADQSRARGDMFAHARQQGAAQAFRRMGREFAHAADGLRPTEAHDYDATPADFVEVYRENDGPLEEVAAA